jgi:predicted nuclease of predicted toxin-antitoxin system
LKLLLDEMVSGEVADRLSARGHEVIAATADARLKGSSDDVLFEAAQELKRAIVTYNRDDFLRIAQRWGHEGRRHEGLLIVNPKRHPNDQFSRLVNSLGNFLENFEPYPSFVTWLQE